VGKRDMSTPDLGEDHACCGGSDAGDLIQALHRVGERGDHLPDRGVEFGDVGIEGIDAGQHLAQ